MFGVLGIRAIKYQHPGIPCHLHASVSSVSSVSFDSLAPAQLALRANLRLLYLKGPALSIVVNPPTNHASPPGYFAAPICRFAS